MGLADYQPETRVIQLKGGSFAVKGLSLVEITTLIRYHLPDVEAIVDLGLNVVDGKADLTEDDLSRLAITFAEQAPGFVANLIALASGETDERSLQNAARLPFPVQVKTLINIAELTFDEVGGVKKAMESVAGLLKTKNPTQLMEQLRA
jgi:hypothetical protein